ncbi:MAG: hypothetical protein PUK14_04185 [Clostridiales bacterium]|nr:hypothetical protein [Clostridiales bacterium]MDY6116952.1 hypothetical protein [Anaerovoracaceae bacterium]
MDQQHRALLEDLSKTSIKERQKIKKIHRELKKFNDGVPFTTMYHRELMIVNFVLMIVLLIKIFS